MSNHSLIIKSGFPRAPLANGIGRQIGQLQRIVFKYCKSHGTSRGIRDFLERDLVDFATENPGVVVYVKPRRHRAPVIVADYLDGSQQWMHVKNFERDHIIKWVDTMRMQAKDGTQMRLRKTWHTEFPSIQGPWTPFTFLDPELNITKFPNDRVGAHPKTEPTATEKLIKLFRAQQAEKSLEEKKESCN